MTHVEILEMFRQLPFAEKERTLSVLEAELEGREGLMNELGKQLEQSRIGTLACPHCKSEKTIRRGSSKGVDKFTCNECKKHFRGSYGTALFRIRRKDKWQAYLKLMEQGYSIKRAAQELGISIQTSFDWRHKILASLQSCLPVKVGGIVECDELQLTESDKGNRKLDRQPRKRGSDGNKHSSEKVSVITAVSRSEGGIAIVVDAKKISGIEAGQALAGRLEEGTVLITDENSAYNTVKKQQASIIHTKVKSSVNRTQKPKDKIHLQTINNQHKQIRDFLAPFNGVATKYLPNYLNWFLYRQSQTENRAKVKDMLFTTLSAATALDWLIKLCRDEILIRT